MTTATEPTRIAIPNNTFEILTTSLVALQQQGAAGASQLADAFTASRSHKGHSRLVEIDQSTANTLGAACVFAQTPENERSLKLVTDKIDKAFPNGTAVLDQPENVESQPADPPKTDDGEPTRPVAAPNAPSESQPKEDKPKEPKQRHPDEDEYGVFNPDQGRTPISAIKVRVSDLTVPDVAHTALVRSVAIPDLSQHTVSASGGAVRYRAKSRRSGANIAIVDLKQVGLKSSEPIEQPVAIVCEMHGLALPMPLVRPGTFYIRKPERFCAACAASDRPAKAAPAPKEPKARTPKRPALKGTVTVVEKPETKSDTPAVIHPSDDRADSEAWTAFAEKVAEETNATVIWSGDKHYSLQWGDDGTKAVDVYVGSDGISQRFRAADRNHDTLQEARRAIGLENESGE